MKFELCNVNIGIGTNMVIERKEFLKILKIKDNKIDISYDEYNYLVEASNMFTMHNFFNDCIKEEEVAAIIQWLVYRPISKVIFAIQYSSFSWYEIYVEENNKFLPVVYSDDNGETLKINVPNN